MKKSTAIRAFQTDISPIAIPKVFPYLFSRIPHPLCRVAAEELQADLQKQTTWHKLLGASGGEGKMFGVLVVQDAAGVLGYLASFSGAIGAVNHHPGFVPPVYDLLQPDGFFKLGEARLDKLNAQILRLEQSTALREIQQQVADGQSKLLQAQQDWSLKLKTEKLARKKKREELLANACPRQIEEQLEALNRCSQLAKIAQKKDLAGLREEQQKLIDKLHKTLEPIIHLKQQRKEQSAALQTRIFEQFKLLNNRQEPQSVLQIFQQQKLGMPPAGAGDCAAPKLLQYAFQQQLQPIALAEFWWGASPQSALRRHGQFYPPCQNKCAPIFQHMMQYIAQEDNPIASQLKAPSKLEIIYEDDWLLVVNKPDCFLSVPGKIAADSVAQRLKKLLPSASEPLLVHRLDMATSGLLLVAKDRQTHRALQSQFIKRTVEKRYAALLDGIVEADSGAIDLPLRVDLHNRPQQLVCAEHGKAARTLWEVIERKEGKTRVYFQPITGRTHQLRMHAAHHLGLNAPIVGDALYGKAADRLYLHACYLEITHPHSQKRICFHAPSPF